MNHAASMSDSQHLIGGLYEHTLDVQRDNPQGYDLEIAKRWVNNASRHGDP